MPAWERLSDVVDFYESQRIAPAQEVLDSRGRLGLLW